MMEAGATSQGMQASPEAGKAGDGPPHTPGRTQPCRHLRPPEAEMSLCSCITAATGATQGLRDGCLGLGPELGAQTVETWRGGANTAASLPAVSPRGAAHRWTGSEARGHGGRCSIRGCRAGGRGDRRKLASCMENRLPWVEGRVGAHVVWGQHPGLSPCCPSHVGLHA